MTRLVVVLWVRVAPPSVQRLGFLTPRHSDARPGCGNRLRSYALLRTRTMFVPRLVLFCSRAAPCESRPFFSGRFHEITIVQAVLQSDLCSWLYRDSLSTSLEANWILESQETPMPVQGCAQYSTVTNANQRGECLLQQQKHLRDKNFMGDRGHSCDAHLLRGSRVSF